MNKKLTTIMLAVLLLLIGKVDAATLTQYVGEHYISQTVNEGQTVRLRFINQSNYTFTNWTVESGNVTIDTTNPTITFTMPNSDVVIRGNYAEEVATPQGTTLSSVAEVGSYVTYVPSSASYTVPTTVSGYTSDQIYNPSNTTSWRVLSNDGTNVEIISIDSVGTLYLGGATGYTNVVQTLNDMSAAYVNSTYAESGRSLGYYDETRYVSTTDSGSAMTETELANYKTIDTSTYPLNNNVSGFPYTDYQYMPDKTTLSNRGMYHSSDDFVWLASHHTGLSSSRSQFYVRLMSGAGELSKSNLYYMNSAGIWRSNDVNNGVRPIITLKSGLTVTGTGTEADPYVINESNLSQYTVTYCANGGYGEMVPQSVSQGSSLTLSTNTYAHHSETFLGWSTSATATTATYTNRQTITPTADMTLYAVWGEDPYPTLASNWMDNLLEEEYYDWLYYIEIVDNLEDSEYYSNYSSDFADSTPYNVDVDGTGEIKLYYGYNSDGDGMAVIVGNGSGMIKAPENSTGLFNELASYIYGLDMLDTSNVTNMSNMFSFWMEELDLNSWDTSNVTNMSNMFSGYAEVLNLSDWDISNVTNMSNMFSDCELGWLDLSNWNTSNVTDMSDMFYLECLNQITIGPNFTPSKTNLGDKEWYLADGTQVDINTHSRTSATTYYSYMLSYNANGGSGAPETQYGAPGTFTISSEIPTKTDYTFLGWATYSGATSASYQPGDSITLTTDKYLYAVWQKTGGYTLTYNANGGSGAPASQTGITLTISSTKPTRSGYTFKGWATYSSATTATYTSGNSITLTADKTLYAVWTKTTTTSYTLTYNANGGSGAPTSQTGTTLTISSTKPTRSGYTFKGWAKSSSATSASYQPGGSITISANTTLYAVWTKTTTTSYTLTYDANGGSGAPTSQTGTTITISSTEPTKSGYTFKGWSESSSATSASYQAGSSITLTANTTLYAVWGLPSLSDVATVGAYVTYVPSSTSYTVSTAASGYESVQTYNPSTTTSWRVLSNDGTNVEIISADSVGTLYLHGATGYINAVQTLNDMSEAYVNSEYAESGRGLGYYDEKMVVDWNGNLGDDMTQEQKANYRTINTSLYPLEYNVTDGFPYVEMQNLLDMYVLKDHGSMYHSSEYVWLASRDTYSNDLASDFYVKGLRTYHSTYLHVMYRVNADGSAIEYTLGYGVRPVVCLKSNLVVTGGSGTSSDPYIVQ